MMYMSDLLRLLTSHLASGYPLSDSREVLMTLTASLPPLSGAGFECHLSQPTPRTDFLIRAGNFDGGREALAGKHASFAFDHALTNLAAWLPLLDFGQTWVDPKLPLFSPIENVWLEFDQTTNTLPSLVPSVFFDVNRHGRLTQEETMDIMQRTMASLGPEFSALPLNRIRDCLNRAPVSARLDYVGVMLPRATNALRICLSGFDLHQIPSYLRAVDWPGDLTAVTSMLDIYSPGTSKLIVDLDVGTSLEPTIGLELFFPQPNAWANGLDCLATTGLCTQATVDWLLSWPGTTPLPTGKLQEFLSTAMRQDIRYLIRRLNHLKVSLDTQKKLNAKAYLYFCYA